MGCLEVSFPVEYWKMAGWLVSCVFQHTVSYCTPNQNGHTVRRRRAVVTAYGFHIHTLVTTYGSHILYTHVFLAPSPHSA